MNLMMLLEMASSAFGERVAFGSKDGSGITYQELYERAGKASEYSKETNAEHVSFLAESNLGLPISLLIIMGWPAFCSFELQACSRRSSGTG